MDINLKYWSLFIIAQLAVSFPMLALGVTWLINYFLAGYIIGDEMERIYKWVYGE